MVECRSCRGFFRTTPEKIGARCPKCKAPLFERADRQAGSPEMGACAVHPAVLAVVACPRCGQNVCGVCRTKWHGVQLCPTCVELSLSRAEPNPRDLHRQGSRAVWSLTLAVIGWTIALATLLIVILLDPGTSLGTALFFTIVSMVPALFALGQGCPVLLTRGPRFRIAASGMILAGAHLGLVMGMFLLNFWHN